MDPSSGESAPLSAGPSRDDQPSPLKEDAAAEGIHLAASFTVEGYFKAWIPCEAFGKVVRTPNPGTYSLEGAHLIFPRGPEPNMICVLERRIFSIAYVLLPARTFG